MKHLKILEFKESEFNRQADKAKVLTDTINNSIKHLLGNEIKLNDTQLYSLFIQRDLNIATELIPEKIKGNVKREIERQTIIQFLNEAIQDLPVNELIGFEKGKCIVSVKNLERLKDSLTKSIKTPEGVEFYNKLEQAVNLLNEAFNGSIPFHWRAIIGANLTEFQKQKFYVANERINYDELAKSRIINNKK